jgi:hypothetical protein
MKNLKNLFLGLMIGISVPSMSQNTWSLNWCDDPYQSEMNLEVGDTVYVNEDSGYPLGVTCEFDPTNTNLPNFESVGYIVIPNCDSVYIWVSGGNSSQLIPCINYGWEWSFAAFYAVGVFPVDQTSSIGENKIADFSMFPNPTSDVITIQVQDRSLFSVFSMSGQLVMTSMMNFGSNTIDLSDLPSGVYSVKVGNVTKQLVRI